MLDITTISRQNVSSVVGYYADAKDDYYSKDSSFSSWLGEGADALNLEGAVDSRRFKDLLVGEIDPFTQMQRQHGDASKERLGYDLTFSAPKGVSMQALIHGDKSIIEAHEKAVAAAVKEAEKLAQARTTTNGRTQTQNTGNLVVATFRHETSRALDPELHTHAVVLNMTQREDGKWRALKNDELMRSKMHLGDVYKQELAMELANLGYELRFNSKSNTFDLAHFSEQQIKAFSQRSTQIEQRLEAMGLSRETADAQTKSRVSLATRDRKTDHSRDEIHKEWVSRARAHGIDFENTGWKGHGKSEEMDITRNSVPDFTSPEVKADRAIQFAVKSLSERDASFSREKLIQVANKHALGRASQHDVESAYRRAVDKGAVIEGEARYASTLQTKGAAPALDVTLTRKQWISQLTESGMKPERARFTVDDGIKSGRLKKISHRVTTVEGIKIERSILNREAKGRNQLAPVMTREEATQRLAGKTLKAEQLKSVIDIVTTKDRFVAAHGYAGTGKSYMTMSATEALKASGMNVQALAPYGTQKKSLEEDGMPARTVASFLKAKDKKLDEKSVVFIDEAGVIPARQMDQLMREIEKHGARAVFLGDTSQTKAVEAGKPFEQLIQAGMQTSYMKDIQRQKNERLLEAVKLAAEGNTSHALRKIDNVNEIKDQKQRLEKVAERYMSLSPEQRDNTLIISGTNESRNILNNSIRDSLGLIGTGKEFKLLDRLDTTQAERRDSRYYAEGQIVIPEQDYKNGLKRGEAYRVIDTGPGNKLTVMGEDGQKIGFSPRTHTRLSVYSEVNTELASGDSIMITRNNKTLDIANGDRFKVIGVDNGKLSLEGNNGRKLELNEREAAYVSYAYATTVAKSQGLTRDRTLYNIDTKSLTTSKDAFYVGISRARYAAEIFTDDKKQLAASISRDSPKTTATEIDRFLGTEQRYVSVNRAADYSFEGSGTAPKAEKEMAQNSSVEKSADLNMTSGTDYQPVENAEDMFQLRQNPQGESNRLVKEHEQKDEKQLHQEEHASMEQIAHEYADYSGHDYESFGGEDFDYDTYEQYQDHQTSKEMRHEHEHEHRRDENGFEME